MTKKVKRLWNFLKSLSNPNPNIPMPDSSEEKIIVHSTKSGKLYVEDSEFFKNKRIQHLLKKLRSSQLYKTIKQEEQKQSHV